jgi:hypothetical protein
MTATATTPAGRALEPAQRMAVADQNGRDHTALREAVASGRVEAVEGL